MTTIEKGDLKIVIEKKFVFTYEGITYAFDNQLEAVKGFKKLIKTAK